MTRSFFSFCICLMFLSAGDHLSAQSPARPSNVGSEFFLSFPSNWETSTAPSRYVRLYIASTVVTQVQVYGGSTWIDSKTTEPNSVITIDIPLEMAQAVVRNDQTPIPNDQVYPNKAIRITSDDPITVYAINRVTYTTDGILALPTASLGTEYVVASAPDISDHNIQKLPSQYVVTATEDNTVLTIINSWDTYGNSANVPVTVTLQKGDVYSVMGRGALSDLTGTLIHSNNPVAVVSGQFCAYLPDRRYPACDHLVEMMLPVSSWGKVYHLIPLQNRLHGDLIRVFSGAPLTTLKINGEMHATLPAKGGVEGQGWFQFLETERRQMEFTADKPIYVAQYNNGQTYDAVTTDPFMLVLTPVEQYQTSFIFSTPGTDYPQNFINLAMDSSGWKDIEIAAGGTDHWKKLSIETGALPKNFPTLINGVRYAGVSFEIKPGVYRLRGTKPFAGYIYGWSDYDSYGYPLSVTVADLANEIPTSAPASMRVPGLTLGPITPTPSDDFATLEYQVPSVSSVEISLVDVEGRIVSTLLQKQQVAAGRHTLSFDVSALPAGSYFCRMSVGDRLLVQPLVVR